VHAADASSDWPLDEPSVTRFAVLVDGDVRGLVQYAEEDEWHDGLLMELLAEDLQRGGAGTIELRVAHTADLTPEDLQAVRDLLDGAFPSDEAYTEHDHEHALGGVHALLWEGAELIALRVQVWTARSRSSPRTAWSTPRMRRAASTCLPGSAALTAGGDLACDWRDGDPW
jgi:hypothetical protein